MIYMPRERASRLMTIGDCSLVKSRGRLAFLKPSAGGLGERGRTLGLV